MSATYHCRCPTHGDDFPNMGEDYTEDAAECAEVAAARYALFFAKRFCNRSRDAYHVFVLVTWVGLDGPVSTEVRVDVKQDEDALWGWRIVTLVRT